MSAIEMRAIAEPYIRRRATRHLEKGRGRHLWRRDGQSVLFNGYSRRLARDRDRRRSGHQSHEGGWHV